MFQFGTLSPIARSITCAGLILTLAGQARAQSWDRLETDEAGFLLHAEGRDETGRQVRLSYASARTESGFSVTGIFFREGDVLAVHSRIDGEEDRLVYTGSGGSLMATRTDKGRSGESLLSFRLPDGSDIRFGTSGGTAMLRDTVELTRRLTSDQPLYDLTRSYLGAVQSLPLDPPPTADTIAERFLVARSTGGLVDLQSDPFASLQCYQECANGCPDQCAYVCDNGWRYFYPLCDLCMASCSIGCSIGCTCFTCEDTALPGWRDHGSRL